MDDKSNRVYAIPCPSCGTVNHKGRWEFVTAVDSTQVCAVCYDCDDRFPIPELLPETSQVILNG